MKTFRVRVFERDSVKKPLKFSEIYLTITIRWAVADLEKVLTTFGGLVLDFLEKGLSPTPKKKKIMPNYKNIA